MIGTYQNKFCDSIYRLYYSEERVLDSEGKPTKKTKQILLCQRMASSVNPNPGDPFTPKIEDWEQYLKLGSMIKID